MLLDHPFGVGYRNYLDVAADYLAPEFLQNGKRAAHNNYFTIVCETGIEGFTPWILAFLGSCWMLRKIRKRADLRHLTRVEIYAMGIEIGLYGWMVTGFFHNTHETDPAYWFVGLAVVLTRLHAQQIHVASIADASPAEVQSGGFTTEQSEVGA
jgi:O-antigen ligase